ncbi:MAG TPA: hypothetical protein VF832_16770, partial [Longimicrobiales bacterium]
AHTNGHGAAHGQPVPGRAQAASAVGAGALAHRLAGEKGSGGGHATMARATWPRNEADERLFATSLEEATQLLLRRVRKDLDALRDGESGHSS